MFESALRKNSSYEIAGSVTDSEEVCEIVCDILPDILVMGLIMNRKNGLSLVNQLRELFVSGFMDEMPRILMTSRISTASYLKKMHGIGLYHFLRLPASHREILKSLDRLISDTYEMHVKAFSGANISEKDVHEYLVRNGIFPSHSGFTFLVDAIIYCLGEGKPIWGTLSNEIYPYLAEKYNKNVKSIEKDIAFAIRNRIRKIPAGNDSGVKVKSDIYNTETAAGFLTNAVNILKNDYEDDECDTILL